MTPEQERLILRLAVVPGRERDRPGREELLDAFGAGDGRVLCRELLQRAADERAADDVELVLMMALTFGMDRTYLPVLRTLAREPWHTRHQDISGHLEDLGGAEVVGDLVFLAWAGPEFQDYEGSVALAAKAVHGLERIGTSEAQAAIDELRRHPEPDIRALVDRVRRRSFPG